MEKNTVCTMLFENISMNGCFSVDMSINSISDETLKSMSKNIFDDRNYPEISDNKSCLFRSWSHEKDSIPTPMKNGALFLSNGFAQKQFYFVFTPVDSNKSVVDENRNNCNRIKKSSTSLSNQIDEIESPSKMTDKNASIFGSPLKMNSIANLSLDITDIGSSSLHSDVECDPHQLKGLSVHKARKILSKFCNLKNKEGSFLPCMAILCDGMDHNKTLLLGAWCEDGETDKRLTTFRVSCSNRKFNIAFLHPLELQAQDTCLMSCCFELLDKREYGHELLLQAKWTDSHGHSSSRLHTARFTLQASVPFGYRESPVHSYFRQLQHVVMLNQGIKDEELPSHLSNIPFNAAESLQDLFTCIKNGQHKDMSASCGSAKKLNLRQARSSDVTDQLWHIIAQCDTYQDVVFCLKTLFGILKKNEIPLFVRSDNNTMLAKLVRQSSKGLTYFPPLTGLMPLEMVVELGLENMKIVYSSILVENELCSAAEVDAFLKNSPMNNPDLSVSYLEPQEHKINEGLLEGIKKLHHLMDLLCSVDLHADNIDLKTVASHVLNYYKGNPLSEEHKFFIPVDTRQALQEVDKPSMVRREYKLNGKTRVEVFMYELPSGLGLPAQIPDIADTNASAISDESNCKDCYLLTTEETYMVLS